MNVIVQALINGTLTGSCYALAALGMTFVFRVVKVVNFAHGSLLMAGMFAAYWIVTLTGWHPYAALIPVVPMLFCFGYALQGLVIRPVLAAQQEVRGPAEVIIVTTGAWFILDSLTLMLFGSESRTVQTSMAGKVFMLGSYILPLAQFLGMIIAIIAYGLLFWFLRHTRMGRSIGSVSCERDAACLKGIERHRVYNIAFGIGCAIAGIAGCVLMPFSQVYPKAGVAFDLKCFVIVVLGGLGSMPGAILAGIAIGLIEAFSAMCMNSAWTELIVYAVFFSVLFIRPGGMFGEKSDNQERMQHT